jgi:outer membrane protein assembly factor BamB
MPFRISRCIICFTLILSFAACKKDTTPGPPGGLTITNITDSGATINWNAVGKATGYQVFLATDSSFYYNYLVPGFGPAFVTQPPAVAANLTPGTKYFVKVVATHGSETGGSATTVFTTLDADALVIIGSDDYNDIGNASSFSLFALNARDGSIAWSRPTGESIAGSPVVLDGNVYVASTDAYVYSLNLNGASNWKWGPAYSGGVFESTPLVRNGALYIGDLGGWAYSIDASSGILNWEWISYAGYGNIGSSMSMNDSATTVYVSTLGGTVSALTPATGSLKWTTISIGTAINSRPVLSGNAIYVGGDTRLYAFDAQTGTKLWNTTTPGGVSLYGCPAVSNGKVIVGGDDGILYSINTADGSLNWSVPLNGGISSSPIVTGGVIYIAALASVYAVDENSGSTVWKNTQIGTGAQVASLYSGPTVSADHVYAATVYGSVYCLDKASGKTIWVASPPHAGFSSSPCVTTFGGKVYYPGVSGMGQ